MCGFHCFSKKNIEPLRNYMFLKPLEWFGMGNVVWGLFAGWLVFVTYCPSRVVRGLVFRNVGIASSVCGAISRVWAGWAGLRWAPVVAACCWVLGIGRGVYYLKLALWGHWCGALRS